MRKRLVAGVVVAVIVIGTMGWLYAQTTDGRFESVTASPADVLVNASTSVLFTADISDSSFKRHDPLRVVLVRTDKDGNPIDIVGRMTESGKRFRSRRTDSVYSLRVNFNETTVGYQYFRVAGLFRTSPSFFFRSSRNADDDWDTDLRLLNDPRGRTTRHTRLPPLLRKFVGYELSDVFAVTVVPFALPPDPGEAGKQTLAGIDSDGDGVRDDVQRWISISYPTREHEDIRRALEQDARIGQQFLLGSASGVDAITAIVSERHQISDCIKALVGNIDGARAIRIAMRAEMLNTAERSRAYILSDAKLSGVTFPVSNPDAWAAGCQ